MAPSTPPPPSKDSLAALTMASTSSFVMSPRMISIIGRRPLFDHFQPGPCGPGLAGFGLGRRGVVLAEHHALAVLARVHRQDVRDRHHHVHGLTAETRAEGNGGIAQREALH